MNLKSDSQPNLNLALNKVVALTLLNFLTVPNARLASRDRVLSGSERVYLKTPSLKWMPVSLLSSTLGLPYHIYHFISQLTPTGIARGKIDLMLVIGTTAIVYPAAQYVTTARKKGARIVVVNMEAKDEELGTAGNLGRKDFLFQGDAGNIVPEILKSVIGEEKGES